ncbi:MAG: hypothetical protein ACE5KG_05890, partial [Nitrososphaerales archaeon]
EKAQIAIIQDEGSGRLASLDIEKYGRSLVTMRGEERYSDVPSPENGELDQKTVELTSRYSSILNGGAPVLVQLNHDLTRVPLTKLIDEAVKLKEVVKLKRLTAVCSNCGKRLPLETTKCTVCKSTSIVRDQA